MSNNFLIRTIGSQSDIAHILIPTALDTMTAYQLQKKMNFLFTIFSVAGGPGLSINNFLLGIKIALNLLGICDSYVCQMGRRPKKEEINRVEQILFKRGLLKK